MESTLAISFSLPQILSLVWLLGFVTYLILSIIFVYHWRAYTTNATVLKRTFIAYFAMGVVCLASAGLMLLFI